MLTKQLLIIIISVLLQILVLISSLLSISWGATVFKNMMDSVYDPPRPFTVHDYILEMTWNTLAISCRVITLALFASQYQILFAGVVVVQFILWTAGIMYIERVYTCKCEANMWPILYIERDISNWVDNRSRIVQGIGYTFNIILVSMQAEDPGASFVIRYPWYVFYWFITMLHNTILISIWFAVTADTELGYRILAITYVIVAYVVSLIVKTFQTSLRKHNKGKSNGEWEC